MGTLKTACVSGIGSLLRRQNERKQEERDYEGYINKVVITSKCYGKKPKRVRIKAYIFIKMPTGP